MNLKFLLISIVKKIAMSIIEAIFVANLIIDKLKRLISDEKNVVDELVKIIT